MTFQNIQRKAPDYMYAIICDNTLKMKLFYFVCFKHFEQSVSNKLRLCEFLISKKSSLINLSK